MPIIGRPAAKLNIIKKNIDLSYLFIFCSGNEGGGLCNKGFICNMPLPCNMSKTVTLTYTIDVSEMTNDMIDEKVFQALDVGLGLADLVDMDIEVF